MAIQVERLDGAETKEYEAFIDQHTDATAYHHPAWMRAIEEAYGHRCWLITARNTQGAMIGALPVCQMRRPVSDALVSLPFCDLGGPLTIAAEPPSPAAEMLLSGARDLMSRTGIDRLTLRERAGPLHDSREPPTTAGSGLSSEAAKVSLLARLPESPDLLFQGFPAKLRSQIRKAEKNGLTASVATGPAALKAFYPVFAANMHRLGSPVHGKNWFQALERHYGARLLVGLVRLGHRPVAAGIVLRQGQTACIPWASTRVEFNHLAPNMLLYWQLLRYVTEQGCRIFDFGRSTPGEGTFRFKRQWGAQPVPLVWREYCRDGSFTEQQPGAGGPARQWAEACWQRLPLTLANRLGPSLRRHISL